MSAREAKIDPTYSGRPRKAPSIAQKVLRLWDIDIKGNKYEQSYDISGRA